MTLLQTAKSVIREPYAWPGGYAKFLVMADGGCLCPACAKQEWRNIVQYTLWNQPHSGWMPEGADTAEGLEEGESYCDHCGKDLASL